MDISRTENWMHPVMPVDTTWRPMHVWTIGRDYAIAFIIALRPSMIRILPILLKTLIWIVIIAFIALIIWVLQADTSAGGLQTGSPWGPGSGVLHASGK